LDVSLDEQLRRVREGDLDAFEGVVRTFEGPLRAWCVAHCPPGGDADDVAQRVFIEAYRHLADFSPGSDFRAWIFTIARYQMLAESTRLRRLADYHSRLAPRAFADALGRRAETDETADRRLVHLRACLQGLEAPIRAVLAQRYDEGLPLEVIARKADRSVGAVKKQLHLLRARLLDCVRSRLAAETP
jgi:RNA polymerase sigma-70 factor (ECF subfamily)